MKEKEREKNKRKESYEKERESLLLNREFTRKGVCFIALGTGTRNRRIADLSLEVRSRGLIEASGAERIC